MATIFSGGFGRFIHFRVGQKYPLPTLIQSLLATVSGNAVTLTYVASANSVRIEYQLDSGAWTTLTSNTLTVNTEGNHTVALRGVNASGKAGPAASTGFSISLAPGPVTNLTVTPAGRNATVTFTMGARATSTEYSLDNGSWTAITSGTSIAASNGSHTLSVRSRNASGVSSVVSTTFSLSYAPAYAYSSAMPSATFSGSGSYGYALSTTDDGNNFAAGNAASGTNVEVFARNGTSWSFHTVISPPTGGITAFGKSVALSGNGLVAFVGSGSSMVYRYTRPDRLTAWTFDQSIPGPSGFGSGPIKSNRTGTRFATIYGTNFTMYFQFGASFTEYTNITNARAQNGAGFFDSAGRFGTMSRTASNAIYVVDFESSSSTTVAIPFFPFSTSISGDGLVISGSNPTVGSVIFRRTSTSSTTWTQETFIPYNFGGVGQGASDALSENGTMFISSSDAGHTVVTANKNSGTWARSTDLTGGSGFGFSSVLAGNGSTVVVGSNFSGVASIYNATLS